MKLNIVNETARLKAVILGVANANGPAPTIEKAYDPKSIEFIKKGTYPKEEDMIQEMESVARILRKYDVDVFRPKIIKDYNQIFTRDIGFVIDGSFIRANILPDRIQEIQAVQYLIHLMNPEKVVVLPENCHVEGGDVMLHNDHIFIGTYRGEDYVDYITARTNPAAVEAIQDLFPSKKVKSFNLRKSNTNAKANALHLDCCFQPVGKDKAIIHKNGFLDEAEYQWLVDFFGKENLFEIDAQEMYDMTSNIFSIAQDVVISDAHFTRLNAWLRKNYITVEEVSYREIAKQEGLLRCSTLPLIRA